MTIALALFFFVGGGPEQRATDYLAAEVPRWQRDNHCYSCHNNGDGARALYTAARLGYAVPAAILDDNSHWLAAPAGWDHNQGTPGFNNSRLARIQFAAALTEASAAGVEKRHGILVEAARLLVRDQEANGRWSVDTGGAPGAPATYGTALATYMARRTLETAGSAEFASPIERANRWFVETEPANVLDAAAMLLAMPRSTAVRRKCVDRLLAAQGTDGGWGPQLHAPSEPFDTAIVLLAFDALKDRVRTEKAVARGRAFLVSRQQADGSWLETTRPPGQLSYAEHISTTAWALYALLKVKE